MHPDPSLSATLPVLTTKQTLTPLVIIKFPRNWYHRNIEESFLSWSCSGGDHASGKTLYGSSFGSPPVHDQIHECPEKTLFQVPGQAFGYRQDPAL